MMVTLLNNAIMCTLRLLPDIKHDQIVFFLCLQLSFEAGRAQRKKLRLAEEVKIIQIPRLRSYTAATGFWVHQLIFSAPCLLLLLQLSLHSVILLKLACQLTCCKSSEFLSNSRLLLKTHT